MERWISTLPWLFIAPAVCTLLCALLLFHWLLLGVGAFLLVAGLLLRYYERRVAIPPVLRYQHTARNIRLVNKTKSLRRVCALVKPQEDRDTRKTRAPSLWSFHSLLRVGRTLAITHFHVQFMCMWICACMYIRWSFAFSPCAAGLLSAMVCQRAPADSGLPASEPPRKYVEVLFPL